MNAQSAAYFAALDSYIRHFRRSPPPEFINRPVSQQSLQQKIDAMNRAVNSNTPIA